MVVERSRNHLLIKEIIIRIPFLMQLLHSIVNDLSEFFDVDKSILLNRKIGYSESLLFELSTTVKYTFMLSLRSDDVIFLVFVKFCYSFYSKIIRLSSSTCKNNLLRICIY